MKCISFTCQTRVHFQDNVPDDGEDEAVFLDISELKQNKQQEAS